ncbi:MAG: hypothetical protein ABI832_13995 [bacterium]
MTAFNDTLTPQAYLDQIAVETKRGNSALSAAIAQSATGVYLMAQQQVQRFASREIAADATLYTGADSPAGRRLLIAFTGRKNRMMMPLPLFLQEVEAATWDVLVLRDSRLSQFRLGCEGLADTFPDLARKVADLAAPYLAATAIGASMGGLAAIRLGLARPAVRGISIGGRFPTDAARLLMAEYPGPAFDPICACLPVIPRNLFFVHAEGHTLDREAAKLCVGLTGGVRVRIKDQQRHYVLWQCHQTGSLRAFLTHILDPAIDPQDMTGTMVRIGLSRPLQTPRYRGLWNRLIGFVLRKLGIG